MNTIHTKIQKNYPLAELTCFKIGGPAKYYISVKTVSELIDSIKWAKDNNLPVFLLGGGSNMLVSDNGFDGLVIHIKLQGKKVLEINKNKNFVDIEISAGEVWDDFVKYVVKQGWWGIENLSHIPGSLGAFAVQNVGAYGQEASSVIQSVQVYDRQEDEIKILDNQECHFSYRQSIFNSFEKSRYIILSLIIRLKLSGKPLMKYPDIQDYFKSTNIEPSLLEMRNAIISVRDNKLPMPKIIGNSGSFFKNILIDELQYANLKNKIQENFSPEILEKLEILKNKFFNNGQIKIPTAFLIDICDLKGLEVGDAAIYNKHALVIINKSGHATANDVLGLFKKVRQIVFSKTGIKIVNEPELIGFSDSEIEQFFEL